MIRRLVVLLLFVVSATGFIQAQTSETSQRDTIPSVPDSLSIHAYDTTATESRRERRARERREREAQEQLVFKDSARLALEARTRQTWVRSLIIPGWGQYSNGGLWWIKVPVIYGGFVTAGLVFEFNHRYYRELLEEVQYRLANNDAKLNPDYINYNTQSMINGKDYYRRNRDLTVLITLGWYAIGAIEAYTDFMLKNRWNIGDDLAFKISPALLPISNNSLAYSQYAVGLKVSINLYK